MLAIGSIRGDVEASEVVDNGDRRPHRSLSTTPFGNGLVQFDDAGLSALELLLVDGDELRDLYMYISARNN
jgi:hypothetical protein